MGLNTHYAAVQKGDGHNGPLLNDGDGGYGRCGCLRIGSGDGGCGDSTLVVVGRCCRMLVMAVVVVGRCCCHRVLVVVVGGSTSLRVGDGRGGWW